MAFLTRIGKSKLTQILLQCKTVSHGNLFLLHLNQAVPLPNPRPAENPYQAIHNNHAGFGNGVRFFAAPIQFLKQNETNEPTETRINEKIRAEVVRLVIEDEHSVITTREALFRAKQLNLDLVEVDSRSNPPVCKLMDYRKDKFDKEMREKERSKLKKSETRIRPGAPKEIRFSAKTEQKDLEMKALKIKKLMEDGYKVKCTTKGSSEPDVLGVLSRLCELIGDVAVVDSGPTLRKDSAILVVKHVKYGQAKGRVKKLKDINVADETSGFLAAAPEADENLDLEIKEGYADQANRDGNEADIHGSDRTHTERYATGPNMVTSPRAESSIGAQKKYSGRHPVTIPAQGTDHRNPGTRDGPEFQFSNQGRQPPREVRFPRQTRETPEVESGPAQNREHNRYGTREIQGANGSRQGRFGGFGR